MYQIKCDGFYLYDYRLPELIVTDPKLKIATNTVGEASFVIHRNHPYYSQLKVLKSIFEISDEIGVIFRGRMTNNSQDFYNSKAVDLEGLMAFFNDSVVRPFKFPEDFVTDAGYISASQTGNVVEFFLKWLINNHNSQVKDFQKFKLGNVTVSDPNNYITRSESKYSNTWGILKNKLFDSALGGNLCIRYEADGNYIDYLKEFALTNTQEIQYGENLIDLKNEIDAASTYSAVIPIGAETETEETDGNGEKVKKRLDLKSIADGTVAPDIIKQGDTLYSQSAVDDFGWIYAPVEDTTWDDVTEARNLLNKGIEYLAGEGIKLQNNIEISAVDLHFTDAEIRSFRPYRNIKVNSLPHGQSALFPLAELDIDLLRPQNTKIVLGKTQRTLSEITNDRYQSALDRIQYSTDDLKGKVSVTLDNLNDLNTKIEGIDGTYLYIMYSPYADGHEMFVSPDENTMYMGTCSTNAAERPEDHTLYTWVKVRGIDGKGVDKVENYYLTTDKNSGVTNEGLEDPESEGWKLETIEPLSVEKPYLWNFERTEYSDGSYTDSAPSLIGNFSKDGDKGVGISEIQEWYALSNSKDVQPDVNDWSQDLPTMTPDNRFLWNYEVIVYTKGDPVKTDPLIIGVYGEKGENGRGIQSVTNYYLASAADSGISNSSGDWKDKIQNVTKDLPYLWTYEEITYTSGTPATEKTTPVIIAKYTANGSGISSITDWYATNNDPDSEPTDGEFATTLQKPTAENRYLWNYEEITYTEGKQTTKSAKRIIGVYGDKGEQGEPGVGISTVKNYYLASSLPDGVTVETKGWDEDVSTQILSEKNKYLWNYEEVSYTSSTLKPTTTDPCIIGVYSSDGIGIETITEFYLASSFSDGITVENSAWETTMQLTTPTKKYLWNYEQITYTDGSTSETDPVIIGVHGETGKTQYWHIKYSDDGGVTFTDTEGETLGAWIGTYVDFNEADSTNPSDYTWKKFTEDVDKELDDIRTVISSQSTDIERTEEQISLIASKSYVETSAFDSYKEEVTSEFTQRAEQIDMQFTTTTEQINDIDGDLQAKFEKVSKYISFNENGISIGGGKNAMLLTIDNDNGIIFSRNGVPFGWWDGNDFHTGNIVVEVNERAQFGNFAFVPRTDGSLSFLKVDGSSTDAHTHNYIETVITAATCTEKGTKVKICSGCGANEHQEIAALGHDYVGVVTPPTETAQGYTTFTCSRCGDKYISNYIDATGCSHSYTSRVVAATCTEQGYTEYTCSKCGNSYKESYTSATGHSYSSKTTTAATCTTVGTKTLTCTKCSHSYTEDIPVLGHVDSNGDGYCDRCSATTGTFYTLTLNVSPAGAGTTSGAGSYLSGKNVSISATANSGYTFKGWYEGSTLYSSSASTTVTMNKNRVLIATFEKIPNTYTISTAVSPSNSGTVTGGGTYAEGTNVTLTATAANGYSFKQWNDGKTTNPRTVVADSSKTYTATFEAIQPAEQTITEGVETTVNLPVQKEVVYLKFVPKYSGSYTFVSLDQASLDPDGYIYLSDKQSQRGSDTSSGGFSVSWDGFVAGTTYYLAARLWSGTGTLKVKVTRDATVTKEYMAAQISAVNAGADEFYHLAKNADGSNGGNTSENFELGESFYYFARTHSKKIASVQVNENGSVTNYTAESLVGMGVLSEDYTMLSYPWTVAAYELNTTVSFTVYFEDSSGGGSGTHTIAIGAFDGHQDRGSVTVYKDGNDVTNAQNQYSFNVGETITVTAVPNGSKRFTYWSINNGESYKSDNPYTFTVATNINKVAAMFSAN